MKTPIFVRPLSEDERESLQKGLRSKDTFTMRRSPDASGQLQRRARPEDRLKPRMRLANGARRHPRLQREGSRTPSMRNPRAPREPATHSTEKSAEALREMLHRSPREFGYAVEPVDSGDGRARPPSRRGSPKSGSRGRPSGRPFAPARGAVDAGQAVDHLPRPLVRKKKRRRDRLMEVAASQSRVGGGFPGRVLVEPGGPAHPEQLLRGGQAPAPHPAVGRQRRPRAEGHLLLRTLPARDSTRRG